MNNGPSERVQEPQRPKPPSVLERVFARILAAAPWAGSPRFLLAAALAIGVIGAGFGFLAAKSGAAHFVRAGIVAPATAAIRGWLHIPNQATWETYDTQLGVFETARVSVAAQDGGVMAALEELDGHLIFMAQHGDFSTLSPDMVLRSLDIDVPMHTDAVRAANITNMHFEHFRALDLLAVETGAHVFDLYASYDRFNPAEGCFDIAVSRMQIAVTPQGVTPESNWQDIYATTPCVPPRTAMSPYASAFVGIQSGGRLALLNPDTLLLSVGDLEFDGVLYPGLETAPNGPQDLTWDLGKVLMIDLETGAAQHLAMGFRNPQGLLIDAGGRIWETEHGPYGGDEINLIHSGGNYGWPNVTYGMQYIPIRENWPLNPTRGGHEGYERPAYVFVPAIGISQLIQPSTEAFPFWSSSLLVTSLRGRALYALRLDGERIMYAEPLPMGERLRDIINRANGDIAILTDLGNLALLRPHREGAPKTLAITDQRTRSHAAGPADEGRRLFAGNCQSCHSVTGRRGAGPALNGVIGRDIGSLNFTYSPTLSRASGVWTPQRLRAFLTEPETNFAGTTMPDAQVTPEQARALIAYLRTTEAQ